jgi:hypothetical protein
MSGKFSENTSYGVAPEALILIAAVAPKVNQEAI